MTVEHDRDVEIMVVFDDDDDGCLLSETQKSNGLTRTLLFVNSEEHNTISELRSYIIHTFHLQNIIFPDYIHLSINGFSLLPFEQTCKLNNKVIRCVKKTTALPIDKVTTEGCQSDINWSEDPNEVRILNTKKPSCTTIEASPIAPQHVENDIHVKQNEHPHSPGSDGSTELDLDECSDKLSEKDRVLKMLSGKSLGMTAGDIYLMNKTCSLNRRCSPMSVLYYIRCMLLFGALEEVDVVAMQILVDKVKDGLKELDAADLIYYEMKDSKSNETSRNDDPAVEPAVDTQGSNKSKDLDDTKQAQSLESIEPSAGALAIAQGVVAFCKLIPKTMFHSVFKEEIGFNDLVLGIIDGIITTKDLACAHQLFEDKHADKMLSLSDDDEE